MLAAERSFGSDTTNLVSTGGPVAVPTPAPPTTPSTPATATTRTMLAMASQSSKIKALPAKRTMIETVLEIAKYVFGSDLLV